MIIEHAELTIDAGTEEKFLAAFAEAREVISEADGFLWVKLHRGVERPCTFLLLVGWESVEAHTEGFRASERFTRWRSLIGPYFATAPVVEHFHEEASFRPLD
ncbi:antibiotic biosynthesis monooxygenase family protein [Streptomyces sp. SDT5-1]|uniref:antibiotic biosynthesis monooxygenase family protein n=1 Tax=Streptomyces sp. SDT5-1 TaxID=3406418 RepID=UPI003FCF2A54